MSGIYLYHARIHGEQSAALVSLVCSSLPFFRCKFHLWKFCRSLLMISDQVNCCIFEINAYVYMYIVRRYMKIHSKNFCVSQSSHWDKKVMHFYKVELLYQFMRLRLITHFHSICWTNFILCTLSPLILLKISADLSYMDVSIRFETFKN